MRMRTRTRTRTRIDERSKRRARGGLIWVLSSKIDGDAQQEEEELQQSQ